MTTTTPETKTFQTEIRQLLDILVHSLYTDREIFLRELISNASDALHRVKFEMLTNQDIVDPEAELAIRISGDPEANTITISDSGIGMTRDELIENLGTIAHSGAASFVQSLQEGAQPVEQIGQFGVGFYSVFMVADSVKVTSRSHRPDESAWTWTASGENSYTLEPAEKVGRGTIIEISLKEDAKEFAEVHRLRAVIHKHSDFVSFPIYLDEETEAINRQQAIWRLPASEVTDDAANDYYKQITYDFTDPMTRIQINTDVPVQIRALLFIPAKLDRGLFSTRQDFGLRLYSHQIRIQDHYKELLPNYMRFVEGVIDSDDVPLNVSRESVQSSPFMLRIKKVLTGRVLSALSKMADKEPEQYATFWTEFGTFIKEGAINEYGDQGKLTPLLRFHSSQGDDQFVSLNDYIGRADPTQKTIYYIVGDDLSTLQRSPHLDAFHSRKIEVLYFTDPMDGFLPSSLREYEDFSFQNVDDAGLELPKQDDEEAESAQDAVPEAEWSALVERFKTQLGDKVVEVRRSDLLVEHPARLVSPEGSMGSEMDRVRRLMDEHYEIPKKALELNPRHPIVTNLASLISTGDQDDLVNVSIEQIYENGLLLEGLHPNPADMVEHIQKLMEAATRGV